MVELWYNTKFDTTTQMTPFETLYGYVPTIMNLVDNGDSLVEVRDYTTKQENKFVSGCDLFLDN